MSKHAGLVKRLRTAAYNDEHCDIVADLLESADALDAIKRTTLPEGWRDVIECAISNIGEALAAFNPEQQAYVDVITAELGSLIEMLTEPQALLMGDAK